MYKRDHGMTVHFWAPHVHTYKAALDDWLIKLIAGITFTPLFVLLQRFATAIADNLFLLIVIMLTVSWDHYTGVRRAARNNEPWVSNAWRLWSIKVTDYMMPLLLISLFAEGAKDNEWMGLAALTLKSIAFFFAFTSELISIAENNPESPIAQVIIFAVNKARGNGAGGPRSSRGPEVDERARERF